MSETHYIITVTLSFWHYLFIYLFIYLFKIDDRTRGPLILPEVHKNTPNTQHKLNKGKKENKTKHK